MLQRKYMLVERDRVSRGLSIISYHWFRWTAAAKARALKARYARQFNPSHYARFDWEVDTRCN